MSDTCAAIIPAAGSGTRMGAEQPKQFLTLAGKPILVHTVEALYNHPVIDLLIIVVPRSYIPKTNEILSKYKLLDKTEIIAGGIRRQDSVLRGLTHLGDRAELVLIHDGARPLVDNGVIDRWYREAVKGAAISAIPVVDTLKKGNKNREIEKTINRDSLWQAQTPQGGERQYLLDGFTKAAGRDVTDEAMLFEIAGYPVRLALGSEKNIKITSPEDLMIAENMLAPKRYVPRIGHGFDAHRFTEDRPLVLGGVTIEYHLGLAGHSDADVLTHAFCDALLGAMAKGDIGRHFPDSSDTFKDIYSIKLLERVQELLEHEGLLLANGDLTVICQRPRLAPYIPEMQKMLARACKCAPDQINIKATTTEKMGYTGREEGISCHAVAILVPASFAPSSTKAR